MHIPLLHRLATASLIVVLAGCSGGGSSSAPPPASPPPPPAQTPLPDPATAPALKSVYEPYFDIGAAIEPAQLANAADLALLRKHYDSVTAENAMKPDTLAPDAGIRNFAAADQIVQFALDNQMRVHGHALVWHRTAPAWFFAGDRADPVAYREAVRGRLVAYITEVVTHFRGRVQSWDVVNEVVGDTPGATYRTDSPWYEAFSVGGANGADYVQVAFEAARAADPDAVLFLNDYNTELPGKRANLLAVVDDLRDTRGAPLDGVGHQLHVQRSVSPTNVAAALDAIEARNLRNRITELDISIYADPGECFAARSIPPCMQDYGANVPATVVAEHARAYRALFDVFRARGASIDAVTTWGISDAHTWLDSFPVARTDRPLLFDRDRSPKMAFWAVADPTFLVR